MSLLFKKIQTLLKSRKLSQAEFSRKIQVSPQRYSKWLHGTGEPGPLALLRMARTLNVTMESLVDDDLESTPLQVNPHPIRPLDLDETDLPASLEQRRDAKSFAHPVIKLPLGRS